jgi:hypothetical protein
MATIPLVALDVKQQQQPDTLDKFAQLQQIKASQQQQAIQQQEAPLRMQQLQQGVDSGGVQLQQQQQALKDQQATTTAMQQWDGKDINALYPLILKNGGSGNAVVGLKSKVLEQQQAAATAFKNTQDGGLALVTATKAKGDLIAGALSPLTDATKVPDAQLAQTLTSTVQDLVSKQLLDPQHAQAATQLLQSGNPQQIRTGIDQFVKTGMAQSQILQDAHTEAQTAQAKAEADKIHASTDPTSPLYSPSPAAVAMGTAPGAQQIQAGEVKQAAAKAGAEENARMPGEMALARQRQVLSQGDPNAAAQLLVNGDATLGELKARGATPEFIEKTLTAAHQISGGKYNAQAAEADFQVAKSPAQVAFFGSAKSLTDPGGTLEQLGNAGKLLPQSQVKALNTIADWEKAATSNGPLAHYAATALGVADDYAKVMGGGVGSDSSRQAALDLAKANAGPNARAGAIQGIRDSVNSQVNSRIGNNAVLGRMYGSPASSSSGMVTVQIPGSPAGQIPAAALAKFKVDHPNAQVQQ